MRYLLRYHVFRELFSLYLICIDSEVDTPVPIPNTEVKHFYAEDSVSENRTLQIFFCALIVIKNVLVFANTFLHIRPLFFFNT